jgi:preprotein translocase subunit SecF
MFDIIGRRNWFFLFSALLILPGTIALAIFGLRLGVDFTGGSLLEVRLEREIEPSALATAIHERGFPEATVVTVRDSAGRAGYLVRVRAMETPEKNQMLASLRQTLGPLEEERFESVGPVVGGETTRKAFYAVGAASVLIALYLSFAFRQVPKPWRYGMCAVIALLHDALLVLGLWAIFGQLFHMEVDALFVTGVLTVIGFSVHDTIVVFDRVRENVSRFPGESFARVVNFSVNQTMDRSVMTSLTAVFTLTALLLLGGSTIHNFVLVLLVGIISGTYSSIFNASCMLVTWENGDIQRLWRRLTGRGAAPAMMPA